MTLPEIASELDSLIDRLQPARTLLASLGPEAELSIALPAVVQEPRLLRKRSARQPAATAPIASPTEPSTQAESSTPVSAEAAPVASRPSSNHRAHHRPVTAVPASLAGKLPSGPVAVSAAEIRRRFTPAAPPEPAPQPASQPAHGNSLDDLLRELAHRPLSRMVL